MKKAQVNRLLLVCMFVLSGWLCVVAQISVNTDGAAPDSSAMLDIKSNSKGILVPKMTKAQRLAIAGPATGLLVFQTDEAAGFYFNAGSAIAPNWKSIQGSVTGVSDKSVALNQWYGDKPQAMAYNYAIYSMVFDGQYFWIASAAGFHRFNPSNGYIDLSGTGGSQFEMFFDGKYIWSPQAGYVTKMESGSGVGVANIAVGSNPRSIAYDGSTIWVANFSSANVTPIFNNIAQAAVPVGGNPLSIIFDGTNIWVANSGSNTLSKIDPVTRTVVATIPVGVSPKGLEFDGTHIWLCSGTGGNLLKVDPSSGTIVETYTGFYPDKLMFDGSYMWFYSPYIMPNQVNKLSLSGVLLKTYTLPYSVTATAFDGNNIWVSGGPFLYKIQKN